MSLLEVIVSKNPSFILNAQYQNIKKFASGGFSDVFVAQTIGKTTTNVIVKAPHKTPQSFAEISKEAIILRKLKDLATVPKVLFLQADALLEAMVLEKLGLSLEALKQEYNNFSLKTTILIGCQMLQILEDIHENGVIHRDIKPANILIGEGQNRNKIYLVDFDIASIYTQSPEKKLKPGELQFFGTKAFASRNAHKFGVLKRKDDLESLGYTLIYLYEGKLPWTNMKCDLMALGLIKDQLPKEFTEYFQYLDKLSPDSPPDYGFLKKLFISMGKRFGFNLEDFQCEWSDDDVFLEEKMSSSEIEKDEEAITDYSSSSDHSLQKNMVGLKTSNQKFMPEMKGKGFMKGLKEVFLKHQFSEI